MTSPQRTLIPTDEKLYTFDINQWAAQVHSPQPRHAFVAPSPAVPPPLSSHFQATFARQMEANPPNLGPDPNEIPIPIRPFQNPPIYLSPTIEEIELLTLNSGPMQDMGDYLVDDLHAITLWEHLQQNLFNARQMEGIARNLREQAMIEWERFRTKKYDMRIMGIVERERAVMRRFEEEGSGLNRPRLVVENTTPPFADDTPWISTNANSTARRRTFKFSTTILPVLRRRITLREVLRTPSSSKKTAMNRHLVTRRRPNRENRLLKKNGNSDDDDE
jgi:hypothetical protein